MQQQQDSRGGGGTCPALESAQTLGIAGTLTVQMGVDRSKTAW